MTLNEFTAILKKSNINFARLVFKDEQTLPYGIYIDRSTDGYFANGERIAEDLNITVELYTAVNDLKTERDFEKLLDDNDISYDKYERTYLNDCKCMITYYEIVITYGKDEF